MKKITLVLAFLLCLISVQSQTIMSPGDIAFMGSNVDGTTNADDSIVFVLLKDIDPNTIIIFTDRGWSNTTGFSDFDGDGEFTWTSGSSIRKAGEIITIDMSTLYRAAYGLIGDQLFAIQGDIDNPTFIAGLQFNEIASGGNDDNWDGEATSNATSELPTALTTGDTAVRLINGSNAEQDNWQFSCALAGGTPISGTPSQIRAILHNRTFWNSNPDIVFSPALEAGCLVKVCHIEIGEQPIDVALCKDETTLQFSVEATGIGNLSYNWQAFGNGLTEWTDLGMQNGNAILNLTSPIQPEASGTQYRVIITDDLGTTDTADDCEVISEIATLTVYPTTMVTFTAPLEQAVNSGLLSGLGGGLPIGGIYSGIGVTDDSNGETYTFDTAFLDGGAVTVTYTFIDTNGCIVRASDNIEVARNPTLVSTDPIDDATGVITEPVLTATFSEPVQFATGGEIIIQNITTGTPFGTVDVSSGAITFSGNGFTIDPMAPFLAGNEYEVQIDATDLEDAAGNPFTGITSGGWTFTIVPAEPVVDCTGIDGVKNNDPGECFYTVVGNEFNATATDNVGVVSLINNYNNGSSLAGVTFPVGTTTVIWTATDADNNMGTCSVDVVVSDNELPVLVCQDITIALDANGEARFNVFSTGALVSQSDNCSVDGTVGVSGPGVYTCANLGPNQVTIFQEDPTGNQGSCTFTVTVIDPLAFCVDSTPPVASCQDVIVQLDNNGNATVSVTDIDNGSSDNEGSITYGVQRRVARVFDQNVAPEVIFGSGNANGSFTNNQTGSVELGLRAKVRYPTPMNTFNSNGDGTYQHLAIAGSPASRAGWNFEWSVNTDPSGTAGDKLSGLTYEMGIDFDASTGTDYYVFDPINQPFADHAIGTNMTANGGGVEATDPASYAGLLAANNVAQNSWNLDFFNELAGKTFDPTVDGTYEVYLKAFDGSGAKVGETKITVIVGNGGAPGMLPQSIDFTVADIGTNVVELIVVDAAGNVAICVSTVTVKSACEVVIETHPQSVVLCENEPHTFEVMASGTGTIEYDWQQSTDGGATWTSNPDYANGGTSRYFGGGFVNVSGTQYRVIATSDNGTPNDATDDCSVTSEAATLTVNPLPMVEITGKDSYCYNGNGVELDAGAGHTSYLWSPGGATTQTITALEGSYTVQVTNEFGCTKISEAFMVTNNRPLVCNILQDVLTTDHETTDGVATVNTTGGTGQFTYLWDNGETTQTATTLTYGMHSVTVTDSNGCETTCQIDIAKELYCWTNLVQNVSVRGGNDGAARVYGNGGFRPYTYLWGDGSTEALNTALKVGTHEVTITDASGAKSQCSVTITEPNKGNCNDFTTSIEQDKLTTDHETLDGVATVYPKGGTGQYTYLWDNGETTQTATTITYGMHSVTVTDAAGCKSISQIDIAKELYCWINIYKNVSVHDAKDGSAMVHGNGGYRPHTFLWDDGSTQQLNSNLKAGTHYVTVTDATGATSQCSITITEPNQEVCDGIDNDGDGLIDEGFDMDGDGVADCFDICDKGDDHVDMDNDGIPDACDDTICIKVEKPMTECYQTAVWDEQTCSWIISGVKPIQPMTGCYQTAEWNGTTCTWDIIDGQRPEMPRTECYQTAVWSDQICDWEINGEKPLEPMTECYQTAEWNEATCTWDILDGQPEMPMALCYQTVVWSDQICDWEINGEKPMEPATECHQTAVFNEITCTWDIEDGQPEMPMTLCYQTAVWSDQICDWEINGEKPLEPMTECYETAVWNEATCTWDILDGQSEMPMTLCYQTAVWSDQICDWEINGEQPEMPMTECYQMAEWNEQTCSWDVTGEQPEMPMTECYQIAEWNEVTCEWDVTGVQPEMPMTACNETAVWNEVTCIWDIIENNNDCGSGTIDQCETAYARSGDEKIRTCFTDIQDVIGNSWGWTNQFPSTNGSYQMDLYAAAGQCNISSGALVGNVEVTYTDGAVVVTVSTLPGNKMTKADLYVGTEVLPTGSNGRFTTAPGQFPYHDTVEGDFNTFTFDSVNVGNSGNFYVVLHADVCPIGTEGFKAPTLIMELTAYPIPFKEDLNVKLASPRKMAGTLSLYNGIGQKVRDYGTYSLKEGDNEIHLNTGDLPAGLYFVRMSSDYGKETLKVLRK